MAQNQRYNLSQNNGKIDQMIPIAALHNVVKEKITWIQDLRLVVQRQKQEQKEQEKEHRIRYQKCCYSYGMLSKKRKAQEMLKML